MSFSDIIENIKSGAAFNKLTEKLRSFINRDSDEKSPQGPVNIGGVQSSAGTKSGASIGGVNAGIESKKAGGASVGGVRSFAAVSPSEQRIEETQEREQLPDIVTAEPVDIYEDDPKLLGEGFVEGEIIEHIEGQSILKELDDGSGDFIDAQFDEIIEPRQLTEGSYQEAPEVYEDDVFVADDKFGLVEASSFTIDEFEDEDGYFKAGADVFKGDLSPEVDEFAATAFDDQGIAAPIYPSSAMPWAAPSEASGFGNVYDEAFEADFAVGDI